MNDEVYSEKELTIIEAARKRFAYYGFSKVTMDEIAADVGMGTASLYYYFPAKEALFEAVIRHEQDEVIANIREMLAEHMPAADKLRTFGARRIEYFRKFINLSLVTLQQTPDIKQTFKGQFAALESRELELLQRLLEEGENAGEFVPGAADAAPVILHTFHGLRVRAVRDTLTHQMDDDAYQTLLEETRQLIELILQGIRNTDR